MMRLRRAAAAPVVLALGLALATAAPLLLSGCSVNPATGEEQFTAFLSPDEERRVGAQEHPKLVEAFGGLYDDPALQRYVSSLGRLLQQTSEQPEPPFTIVILDSPAVNAFALPGGYVHVTRGLMALANDEAELAGVIAHEIGHVTARHSAERYSHGLVAGLGAAILGTVIDNQTVSDIANLAAGAYVQGYSRSQELEADTLGVRYLSRSGFDATAMSSFLEAMEGEAALARKIAGKRGQGAQGGLFASHPRTADRVRATAGAAQAKFGGERARALYLRRIDGMIYGDSPEEGFVRGRAFAHPVLRIAFTAPPGFILRNAPEAVVGAHPSGATMRFDEATLANPSISTWRYLTGSLGVEGAADQSRENPRRRPRCGGRKHARPHQVGRARRPAGRDPCRAPTSLSLFLRDAAAADERILGSLPADDRELQAAQRGAGREPPPAQAACRRGRAH